MLIRNALATAAMVLVAVAPTTTAAAGADTPELVRKLADDAARLVAHEGELLDVARGDGDISATELAAARSELHTVDVEASEIMRQLDLLGVDLSNAIRETMARLPEPGSGPRLTSPPPPPVVYDAAVEDLLRIAATPAASTPIAEEDNGDGSLALLAVAAAALLALGLAALSNTLRRTDDDHDLAAMAWSDGLTGVANRRRLDRDIAAYSAGGIGPTAVIMVDVDHFKRVNDTYGHQVGDDVLRSVGALLAEKVRREDVVYRYGGEEFCVLLPAATQHDARSIADRIVDAVRSITLPDGRNITVSVGVADGQASEVAGTLETADRALYAAKTAGRDRASTADSDSDTETLESV